MGDGVYMRELVDRRVVYWAARECARQESGELSVAWMLDGWAYALSRSTRVPIQRDVIALGRFIEPKVNLGGLRKGDVVVRGYRMMPAAIVERTLRRLLEAWGTLEADLWFREFEEIHPFADGNGRVGSILWNWHRRTLTEPEEPPDFWADRPRLDRQDQDAARAARLRRQRPIERALPAHKRRAEWPPFGR